MALSEFAIGSTWLALDRANGRIATRRSRVTRGCAEVNAIARRRMNLGRIIRPCAEGRQTIVTAGMHGRGTINRPMGRGGTAGLGTVHSRRTG